MGGGVGLGVGVFVLAVATLCVSAGGLAWRWARGAAVDDDHPAITVAASFYIGVAILLVSWKWIDSLVRHATFSLGVVVAGMAVTAWYDRKADATRRVWSSTYAYVVLAVIGMQLLRAVVPLPAVFFEHPDAVNPFGGVGSVFHAFRAANISNFIVSNDMLPSLGQNLGQSMLGALTGVVGLRGPLISLVLWLAVTQGFMLLFCYGFMRQLGAARWAAICGALVAFVGNSALADYDVRVIDSGSTHALVANSDVLMSIMSFVFFWWIAEPAIEKGRASRPELVLMAVCVLLWSLSGAHNSILALASLGWVGVFARREKPQRTVVVVLAALVLVATGFGAMQGGMLSPKRVRTDLKLPGLMDSDPAPNEKRLVLRRPWLGAESSFGDKKVRPFFDTKSPTELPKDLAALTWADGKQFARDMGHALVSHFFIGLGVAAAWFAYGRSQMEQRANLGRWIHVTTATVLLGTFMSLCLLYCGRIWELTRFLSIGNFLAKLLLGCVVAYALTKQRRELRALWGIVVWMAISGPAHTIAKEVYQNFADSGAGREEVTWGYSSPCLSRQATRDLSISERWNALVNRQDIVGTRCF